MTVLVVFEETLWSLFMPHVSAYQNLSVPGTPTSVASPVAPGPSCGNTGQGASLCSVARLQVGPEIVCPQCKPHHLFDEVGKRNRQHGP